MFTPLNWKEVARLAPELDREIRGSFIERLIVPAQPRFPDGFLKGEWALKLTRHCLVFSVRPRAPYFWLREGKGPAAAEQATNSPFGLALSKQIRGAKIVAVRALPRERALEIELAGGLSLLILLIPATPEAVLLDRSGGAPVAQVRSRQLEPAAFALPDGAKAPADLPCRELKLGELAPAIEAMLDAEALALRRARAEKLVRESRKRQSDRLRQSETAASEAAQEPDWQRYGELLKAALPHAPPLKRGVRLLMDYASGDGREIEVPGDPKLDAKAQVTKYFTLARRQAKRASEAASRIEAARESLSTLDRATKALADPALDWAKLEAIEASLGLATQTAAAGKPARGAGKASAWPGRAFRSRDGWAIWVGRTKDENLELTFKCARGNDVWMHVRGKPGAHLLIPVQPGKSVPLETLLDAAQLALHYSGGANWGATEVDYAFKKFVKRIRDSSEASYTHNKTLIVQPDPSRLKRLLGTGAGASAGE